MWLLLARRYAFRDIGCNRVSVCPSVCLSVCLSQAGVVLKRLHVGSRKQRCTIAMDRFYDAKDIYEIPMESPQRGREMQVG